MSAEKMDFLMMKELMKPEVMDMGRYEEMRLYGNRENGNPDMIVISAPVSYSL